MKYYFDTSSIAKIYHREQSTDVVINIYKSHHEIIISELAKIELISTIHRKYREHEISNEALNAVVNKFTHDIKTRYEVLKFSSLIIDEAWNLICRISAKYSLKTQDSMQLSFYKSYCESDTIFVCSDAKLVKIVENEEINVLFVK